MPKQIAVDSAKSVYQVSENSRAGQVRLLDHKAYRLEALRFNNGHATASRGHSSTIKKTAKNLRPQQTENSNSEREQR